MSGVLYQYLSSDHDRLDDLLERATAKPGIIDEEYYADFRNRLLRHISIEEKIVLPAIARWQGEQKAALAERLHLDHGAIVSLMVPPPKPIHHPDVEVCFCRPQSTRGGHSCLYEIFEKLAGSETDSMLEELKSAPAVPVLPHNSKPELLELAKQALARAGHEFKTA